MVAVRLGELAQAPPSATRAAAPIPNPRRRAHPCFTAALSSIEFERSTRMVEIDSTILAGPSTNRYERQPIEKGGYWSVSTARM